jgi:beta-aspartyl-peptidase (threonine type)
MEYKGLSLSRAADEVIMSKLEKVDGRGGIIAVDRFGNIHLAFNTTGMFRAFASENGEQGVKIFRD